MTLAELYKRACVGRLQEMVVEAAEMIISEDPELAATDPKRVGILAKLTVGRAAAAMCGVPEEGDRLAALLLTDEERRMAGIEEV